MKTLLLTFLSLLFGNAFSCETVEPSKSNYIIGVTRWVLSESNCINYNVALRKRASEKDGMFLVGARIDVKTQNSGTIYSSDLELQEVVEDTFLTKICIGKEVIELSNIILSISYPQSFELGERGSYKSGGFACHEEEKIKVSELVKYLKKEIK